MPRPPGSRNADYQESRTALLDRVSRRLAEPDAPAVSFRQLAEAADVSLPTLRHYFGDRAGVLRAVMEYQRALGDPYVRALVDAPMQPLALSVRASLDFVVSGWLTYGAGAAHVLGLRTGLGDESLGPAYLRDLFEPTLVAFERRLARHAEAGDLRPYDLRVAALALLGPVLLALLHQRDLGGAAVRPLEWNGFLAQHVEAWVAGHGASPPRGRRRAV